MFVSKKSLLSCEKERVQQRGREKAAETPLLKPSAMWERVGENVFSREFADCEKRKDYQECLFYVTQRC